MGFSTLSYDLIDLFARIDRGDLQLPDFQRDYSWDVDRIRALIVTVLRGYPMGCLMALDTRNENMRFRPRPLEGAPNTGNNPGMLLLDGQQRLTTLYHSLQGDGIVDTVDFRNKRIRRKFYMDVNKALSADILPLEAVFSVNEKGVVKSHFGPDIPGGVTDRETALAAGVIPVSALLSDEGTDMIFDLAEGPDLVAEAATAFSGSARDRAKHFHNTVAKPLIRYSVPMIRLDRETAQGGVGSIFAQANSAGLQMDVFDLLTAVFANEDPDFKLHDDWADTEATLRQYPALDSMGRTEFLTAVALFVTAQEGYASGQREDILRLNLPTYRAASAAIRAAFVETAEFLRQRCIVDPSLVPYPTQLVPLTVILALLGGSAELGEDDTHSEAWDRLYRWFWCGIFGELYGSAAIGIRAARDIDEVTPWIRDTEQSSGTPAREPATVTDARFVESRLLSVDPESAVYKGIYALIMARGAKDWRTAQPFTGANFAELGTRFSRIFPAQWCVDHDVEPVLVDSVLNHTPMGRRTEHLIETSSPARYLPRVQAKSLMEDSEFDAVLAGHFLDPELLHKAQAEEFFADRRQRLIDMVEYAMGKQATRDVVESDLHGGEEGPNAFL